MAAETSDMKQAKSPRETNDLMVRIANVGS